MYSEDFKKAFKGLIELYSVAELAKELKISMQKIRKIKRELNIK